MSLSGGREERRGRAINIPLKLMVSFFRKRTPHGNNLLLCTGKTTKYEEEEVL